jgi:tetratricopeptide (TPR) repeat protein
LERRLAVHAGARKKVTAWLARGVIAAGVLAATTATAAPRKRDAKAAFDRGVAAYQKGDFAVAIEALGASFKLEADAETLFAWAQSERQLEHCDKAIELFGKLLELDMPAENRKAVQSKIEECKVIVAAQKPRQPERTPEKTPEKTPPGPEITPPDPGPKVVVTPHGPEGRSAWWKDPIGDALVIAGVAGLGVGGYFLYSGHKAEQDSHDNIADFADLNARAEKHGRNGVIASAVGGVLLVGGIVRYATRGGGGKTELTSITGWLAPSGGGLAAFGRF